MLIERIPSLTAVIENGEVILANMSTGRGFALNGTASSVWNALETPRTLEQICAELCKAFEVEPDACKAAVTSLIEQWRDLGLVRTVD